MTLIIALVFFYFREHKATLGILFLKIEGHLKNLPLTMQEKLK